MRITYVARRAWPAVGGIENHVRSMTEALPAAERVQILTARADNGWPLYTDVLARRDFPRFTSGQVTTEPLRVRGAARLKLLPVAAQPHFDWAPRGRGWLARRSFEAFTKGVAPAIVAAADRPDVLHVFSGGNLAAAGVEAAKALHIPLVLTPSAHPGQWDDDALSGRAYRAADRVLAWGEADADTYRRLGVPETRIRISPPCTAHLPRGGGPALRAAHGLDGPLVVYVGRRQSYKGIDLLLAAASKLPHVTVALIGSGDRVDGERVIDAGEVSDEVKAAWLEAADALCLASAHESFGLAVAEGWSFGVPAVTSDIAPLRSLLERAGGGLAVERTPEALARALDRVITDPGTYGQAGHAYWREHLSPEAAAARTHAVYEELLGAAVAA